MTGFSLQVSVATELAVVEHLVGAEFVVDIRCLLCLITFSEESIVSELHLAAVVDVVGTEFVVYIRCPSCLVTTATRGRIFNSSVPSSQAYNYSIAIRPSFPVTSFNSFALPSFKLRVVPSLICKSDRDRQRYCTRVRFAALLFFRFLYRYILVSCLIFRLD